MRYSPKIVKLTKTVIAELKSSYNEDHPSWKQPKDTAKWMGLEVALSVSETARMRYQAEKKFLYGTCDNVSLSMKSHA